MFFLAKQPYLYISISTPLLLLRSSTNCLQVSKQMIERDTFHTHQSSSPQDYDFLKAPSATPKLDGNLRWSLPSWRVGNGGSGWTQCSPGIFQLFGGEKFGPYFCCKSKNKIYRTLKSLKPMLGEFPHSNLLSFGIRLGQVTVRFLLKKNPMTFESVVKDVYCFRDINDIMVLMVFMEGLWKLEKLEVSATLEVETITNILSGQILARLNYGTMAKIVNQWGNPEILGGNPEMLEKSMRQKKKRHRPRLT